MKNKNTKIKQITSGWVPLIVGNILWVIIHFLLVVKIPTIALLILNITILLLQLFFYKTQSFKLTVVVLATMVNMYVLYDHLEFVTVINKCSGGSELGYNETDFENCLNTLSLADKINYGLFNNEVTFSK